MANVPNILLEPSTAIAAHANAPNLIETDAAWRRFVAKEEDFSIALPKSMPRFLNAQLNYRLYPDAFPQQGYIFSPSSGISRVAPPAGVPTVGQIWPRGSKA